MRLTTARYYTPSGRSIQATGIVPDIIVKQSKIEELKSFSERRESDLRGHLDNKNTEVQETEESDNIKTLETEEDSFVDYQLNRALDLLEGISFYKKDHV